MLSSTLNLQSTWGEKLVHPLRCCWICQSAEQLWGYVLYKLKHTGEPLPLCPKEIWLLGLELDWGRKPQLSSCVHHSPVSVPCPVWVASVGGSSEPPPLDVWSGLMFRVLLSECWGIWGWHAAAMQPPMPACLPEWLCSHIPSVERHLWRSRATVCYSLALCHTLSFINTAVVADSSKNAASFMVKPVYMSR